MGKGKPFARGADERRHGLTQRDRSKGEYVSWWQYVFIHWDCRYWTPATKEAARRAWEAQLITQTPW